MSCNYRVTNVCGSAIRRPCSKVGLPLEEMAMHDAFEETVLTDSFAALHIIRRDEANASKIVFLVFSSGVVNAVGFKSVEHLQFHFTWLLWGGSCDREPPLQHWMGRSARPYRRKTSQTCDTLSNAQNA